MGGPFRLAVTGVIHEDHINLTVVVIVVHGIVDGRVQLAQSVSEDPGCFGRIGFVRPVGQRKEITLIGCNGSEYIKNGIVQVIGIVQIKIAGRPGGSVKTVIFFVEQFIKGFLRIVDREGLVLELNQENGNPLGAFDRSLCPGRQFCDGLPALLTPLFPCAFVQGGGTEV